MKSNVAIMFLLFVVLTACGPANNESKKSNFEEIPDGFRQVKLQQKMPDDIKEKSKSNLVGDYVSYRLVYDAQDDDGKVFGRNINSISYMTKNDIVQSILVSFGVKFQDIDGMQKNIIEKFGNPSGICSKKITISESSVVLDFSLLRWEESARVFDFSFNVEKKSASLEIKTSEYASMSDANRINPIFKEVVVECKKFVQKPKPDKDGF